MVIGLHRHRVYTENKCRQNFIRPQARIFVYYWFTKHREFTFNMSSVKNAFYAQSGGATAVINASACGLIETARKYKDKIGKVYAGKNGILGALQEELIDTSLESDEDIHGLLYTPSSAFGSCRYKLKSLEDNREEYERLIEVFRAHNIGYFFYNGGNDSQDTALKISQINRCIWPYTTRWCRTHYCPLN